MDLVQRLLYTGVVNSNGWQRVSTYLLFLNTEQKVDTVEHGVIRGLAIANVATCQTRALAKEYMDIAAGDEVIACNADGIRWRASIDDVVLATTVSESEEDGEAIKVIQGKLTARGSRSIAAACKRMKDNGVALPDIINNRGSGFKQGALANLLTEEQVEELASGLS